MAAKQKRFDKACVIISTAPDKIPGGGLCMKLLVIKNLNFKTLLLEFR